jgi:hypothetical protein
VATYSPSQIRSSIETSLVSALGDDTPPWELSRLAADRYPGADPREVEALSFAVGVGESAFEGRQRPSAGYLPAVRTQVIVKFCSQLRADAHVDDYDTALVREAAMLAALVAASPCPLLIESITREIVGDGLVFLGTVRGTALHSYPL